MFAAVSLLVFIIIGYGGNIDETHQTELFFKIEMQAQDDCDDEYGFTGCVFDFFRRKS